MILIATLRELEVVLTDAAISMFASLVGRAHLRARKRLDQRIAASLEEGHERLTRIAGVLETVTRTARKGGDIAAAVAAVASFETIDADAALLRRTTRPGRLRRAGRDRARVRRVHGAPARASSPPLSSKDGPPPSPCARRWRSSSRSAATGARRCLGTWPVAHIGRRWNRHLYKSGRVDRTTWELATYSEMSAALASGDMWVPTSRLHRSLDVLLAPGTVAAPAIVPGVSMPDVDAWLEERAARLDAALLDVSRGVSDGDPVLFAGDRLRFPKDPKGAGGTDLAERDVGRLAARAYGIVPVTRITDVARPGRALDRVRLAVRARLDRAAAGRRARLPGRPDRGGDQPRPLAHGRRLQRRVPTCPPSDADLAHARGDVPCRLGLPHQRDPRRTDVGLVRRGLARLGRRPSLLSGRPGRGRRPRQRAAHGRDPIVKIHTTITDRYAPLHQTVIAGTAHEAIHALDGILGHTSGVNPSALHVDGGGVSDIVFALTHLLGLDFEPRIPRLSDRRLYAFEPARRYGRLAPLFRHRLDRDLIAGHWDEIGRVVEALRNRTVVPSLILRKLSAYRQQNSLAAALRGIGRVERTLFTLRWFRDPALRQLVTAELNKGEARNSLARARSPSTGSAASSDRGLENQQTRAAALNLVTAAIILFNCRYLGRALIELRRRGGRIDDALVAQPSPLGWDRINLTGDYVWSDAITLDAEGLMPLTLNSRG